MVMDLEDRRAYEQVLANYAAAVVLLKEHERNVERAQGACHDALWACIDFVIAYASRVPMGTSGPSER